MVKVNNTKHNRAWLAGILHKSKMRVSKCKYLTVCRFYHLCSDTYVIKFEKQRHGLINQHLLEWVAQLMVKTKSGR
jgi:hypothetical protein